jgi:LCP family protein required for cell wall assembly
VFYDNKIQREDVFANIGNRPAAPESGQPVNVLLVGSDSRDGLSRTERDRLNTGVGGGERSDTLILMHLSADNRRVTFVSFPRDSYVTIPEHTNEAGRTISERKNKINAAFAQGGPELTIRTVEANTGITVDHYVEVNIAGFVGMVDALGGAEVCLAKPIKDKDFSLPAGRQTLDGETALNYVRTRHVYVDQDLGRIRAQQAFIGSVAREALSAGTLTNPVKLNRFLSAALGSVTTDSGLNRDRLLALANRVRSVQPSSIQFITVPLSDLDYRVANVGSTVRWDRSEAQDLFDAIRTDAPPVEEPAATGPKPTVPPGQIRVQVFNGAGVTGLGRTAATDLAARGFAIAGSAKNADVTGQTTTVIKYDPRYDTSLLTVQAAIPGATTQAVEGLGRTFQIVVGSEWDGARKVTVSTAKPAATTGPPKTTSAAERTCT